MDVSKFLAKVIGIYFIVITFGMFVNMQQFMINVNHLITNDALMFVTGFFTLVLGILMVVSHNIWQWNWRVIITLVAWISLLKGASIIFYPHFLDQVTMTFMQNSAVAYSAAAIDMLLGFLLIYFGFRSKV
jgi:hypothetical protein